MKAFLLSATAALACAAPAPAQVLTMGSNFAHSCYLAAVTGNVTARAKNDCDRGLNVQALGQRDRAATHVNRGILWMLSSDLERANRDFDAAIAIDPLEPDAWLNKAVAQLGAGNSAAALKLAERAIELGTTNRPVAYYVRGVAHEDSGNIRAAYADLRTAASLAPNWKPPAAELARYRVTRR